MRRIIVFFVALFAVIGGYCQFVPTFDSVKFTPDGNDGGILYNVHISGDTLFLNSDTLLTGAAGGGDSSWTVINVDTAVISGDSLYNISVNGDTLFINGDTLICNNTGYWTLTGDVLESTTDADTVKINGWTQVNGRVGVKTTSTNYMYGDLTVSSGLSFLAANTYIMGACPQGADTSGLRIWGGIADDGTDSSWFVHAGNGYRFSVNTNDIILGMGAEKAEFFEPVYMPALVLNADSIYKLEGRNDTIFYNNDTITGGGGSLWSENGTKIYYSTDNVGIGTADPSEKLEVVGNIEVTGAITDGDTCIINVVKNSTYQNTFIGTQFSDYNNASNEGNILIGNVGNVASAGDGTNDYNILIGGLGSGGGKTGGSLTTGTGNKLFGYCGSLLTTGDNNILIGTTGNFITTQSNNIYIGDNAGYYLVSAHASTGNICIGQQSGYGTTGSNGQRNIFVGNTAGYSITSGISNLALMYQAGYGITTGDYNISLGEGAMKPNATGDNNIAIGVLANFSGGTDVDNIVALGNSALYEFEGDFSVAVGSYSLAKLVSNDGCVGIGYEAGRYNTGAGNTFSGYQSGKGASGSSTGGTNSTHGYQAGLALTSGAGNSFFGYGAGKAVNTGNNNLGFATNSLLSLTSGSGNTAIGENAFRTLTNHNSNTGIGYRVGYSNTGSNNVFIGRETGYGFTGSNSVLIGYRAGWNHTGDNKLVIHNDSTYLSGNPLIYGEFDNGIVNVGGYLTVDKAYHLFAYFGDSAISFSVTTAWQHLTNPSDSMWIYQEMDGFTWSNDTITITNGGDYDAVANLTLDGDNGETQAVRFFNVTKTAGIPTSSALTTRSSNNFGTIHVSAYAKVDAGDKLVLQIKSDGTGTCVFKNSTIKLYKVHN